MKRDDVRSLIPGATDETVDAVLNAIGAELNPLKDSFAKLTDELKSANAALEASHALEASLKAQVTDLSAKAQAGMSAEEQLAERERAAAEKEREYALKAASLEAKSVFVEAGFATEDIESLLPRVVTEDSEATRAAAQSLVDFDAKRRASVEQTTRDALLKENPRLGGAGGNGSVTKEQFDKLTFAEQMKLVQENPGLLKQIDSQQ